jgi:hypothetical protein
MQSISNPGIGGNRSSKQLLFVCGCPRSGTTAMRRVLSGHPQVCLGHERYATIFNRGRPISEELFEKERFLRRIPNDTFYDQARFDSYHAGFEQKFDTCRYVGDKIPFLYQRWNDVFALRPQPIVVFLVRNVYDVAESYNNRARHPKDPWPEHKNAMRAVQDWNASLRLVHEALNSGYQSHLLIVEYEGFFECHERMRGLLAHLGLSIEPQAITYLDEIKAEAVKVRSKKEDRRMISWQEKRYLLLHASVGLYRKLLPHSIEGAKECQAPFLPSSAAAEMSPSTTGS